MTKVNNFKIENRSQFDVNVILPDQSTVPVTSGNTSDPQSSTGKYSIRTKDKGTQLFEVDFLGDGSLAFTPKSDSPTGTTFLVTTQLN
jgi:hypothetical protein